VSSCPPGESRGSTGPLLASVGEVGSQASFGLRQLGEVGQGNCEAHTPTVPSRPWGLALVLGKTLSVAAVRLTEAPSGHDKPGTIHGEHRVYAQGDRERDGEWLTG